MSKLYSDFSSEISRVDSQVLEMDLPEVVKTQLTGLLANIQVTPIVDKLIAIQSFLSYAQALGDVGVIDEIVLFDWYSILEV